ncbi:MAG: hypothetical protein HY870_03725 [Chloroflexi bacterium]|nr:hypothetical protein [Chloroflexota bacterium]
MDNKIRETQQRRFQFLLKLFELSNGDELFSIDAFELGDQLGFPRDETNRIDDYLRGENLIQGIAGTKIAITHYGIVEIESAPTRPDEPTTYFPPVNIIHVEKMVGSQIQQGTNQSTQVYSYSTTDLEAVSKFIDDLKVHLNDLGIDTLDQAQVESDIETIEAQVKSPRPKSNIISECLKSLRAILEGTIGSLIATGLLQQLAALIK